MKKGEDEKVEKKVNEEENTICSFRLVYFASLLDKAREFVLE